MPLIIHLEEFYGDISLHGEWEGERNGEGEGAIKCYSHILLQGKRSQGKCNHPDVN